MEAQPSLALHLTNRFIPHTFDDMKDAMLTIRVPAITRKRIEALARRDGRSLSQQAERLLTAALDRDANAPSAEPPESLADRFAGPSSLSLKDFKAVRSELSRSLRRPRPKSKTRES